MQVPSNHIVTAQELHLVDSQGRTRMRLATQENGTPCLEMLAQDGQAVLGIEVSLEGRAKLRLLDSMGRPRAILGVFEEHSVGLALADETGATRLALGLNSVGPSLSFLDEQGQVSVGVGLDRDHQMNVIVLD